MDYSRFPAEIKNYDHWAVAGASKAPMAFGSDGKLRNISVNEPATFLTFADALAICEANRETVTYAAAKDGSIIERTGLDLGFILTDDDPFTVIDLDVKDATTHPHNPELWTTPDDYKVFGNIRDRFGSFMEYSRSGKGFHIWLRGDIGPGFRRGCVEVYSRDRFMICTGNVVDLRPIVSNQTFLDVLVSEMRPMPTFTALTEELEEEGDWYILQMGLNAANNDKFRDLYDGKWAGSYPSQSEADLALMSMLAFYSRSNEQCRRMFRKSELGKRDKATQDNVYLNRTLTIIRDRIAQAERAEITAILVANEARAEEIKRLQHGVAPLKTGVFVDPESMTTPLLTTASETVQVIPAPPAEASLVNMIPNTHPEEGGTGIAWPPGALGHVARFVYDNSYLPIKEVSIVAALGLAGGLCGRSWNIPQSGLNLYVVLVARSAIGKEAMHTGISTLMAAAQEMDKACSDVADFTEYASGPALMKACSRNPCFVNVQGEFGRKLQRMAKDDGGDTAMQTLRTAMTNLYQKSGDRSTVGGLGYSNKEENVESMYGVAYSMIGETTPTTFYESLTEDMMADGFLSRFTIVNYEGDRPANRTLAIQHEPDPSLVRMICAIRVQATLQIDGSRVKAIQVGKTNEAAYYINQFDEFTAQKIRGTNVESERQLWNRASLKVQRIAALLAVFENWYAPVITLEQFEWAKDLIRRDIEHMLGKLQAGDVGTTDNTRETKAKEICREYLNPAYVPKPSYHVDQRMRANNIITREYLSRKTSVNASFYKYHRGHAAALTLTIDTLIADGVLMPVKDAGVMEQYGFGGKCYRILNVK